MSASDHFENIVFPDDSGHIHVLRGQSFTDDPKCMGDVTVMASGMTPLLVKDLEKVLSQIINRQSELDRGVAEVRRGKMVSLIQTNPQDVDQRSGFLAFSFAYHFALYLRPEDTKSTTLFAMTGSVDRTGAVLAVQGLQEKIGALIEFGRTTSFQSKVFVLPSACLADNTEALQPVLDEMLHAGWEVKAIASMDELAPLYTPSSASIGAEKGRVWKQLSRRTATIGLSMLVACVGVIALLPVYTSPPQTHCADCPEMVEISARDVAFSMGAGDPDERSEVREIDFACDFEIAPKEVTRAEWQDCEDAGLCGPLSDEVVPGTRIVDNPAHPAAGMNWQGTQAYLSWLNATFPRETGDYRLPTEAEWEFAARACAEFAVCGDFPFATGETITSEDANYDHARGFPDASVLTGERTPYNASPVGSYPSNAFGLYDMHGNVAEWVQDCPTNSIQQRPDDGSAFEGANCSRRIIRGGGFQSPPEHIQLSHSTHRPDDFALNNLGFRIARDRCPL